MLFQTSADARHALIDRWRWPNFAPEELACRCAGRFCAGAYWHDPVFLDRLQDLRQRMGAPIQITSGHRCALWNAAAGGAPRSQHKRIAADIALRGHDRMRLLDAATAAGFGGIGLASTFLHLDGRTRRATWFYEGSRELWQI
ncbi:MAG: D-Ala-D-Ala carboxypeptidase family metallohydrolase [Pseudomonadota bacterium]|nr:D-Ala-D-Ala carboxypeptidase family metallohydrolase [Pseudomonadota bacterium]